MKDDSSTEEIIAIPAIYFDTEPLRAAGWPNPSAELLEAMSQAESLGIPLFLPTVVQQELEAQWLRETAEAWKTARSRVETLKRRVGELSVGDLHPCPSRAALGAQLSQRVKGFAERFVSIPLTSRSVAEFVALAVNRGAAFDEKGRGFRDSAILCSVLDHMVTSGFQTAVIVSKDGDFRRPGVSDLAREKGLTLEVLQTLDDLQRMLRKRQSALALQAIEDAKAELIEAVRQRSVDLQRFLESHLEIVPQELRVEGVLSRVAAVKLISIEDAHASLWSWWSNQPSDNNTLRISIEAKAMLTLEVENYTAGEPIKLKVGAPDRLSAANILNPFEMGLGSLKTVDYERMLIVEGTATRAANGHAEIEFQSVRLKGERDERRGLAAFMASMK